MPTVSSSGSWKSFSSRAEVVLGLVDGELGAARRGPADAGAAGGLGAAGQLVEAGELALGGADHLQAVERGHARAGLVEIDARVGEVEPLARGADREAQGEALAAATRSSLVSSPRRARSRSRRMGSSFTFCGNSRSATPGTKTTANESPRAASTGPTKTRPAARSSGRTTRSVRRRRARGAPRRDRPGPPRPSGRARRAPRARGPAGAASARQSVPRSLEPLAPGRARRQRRERAQDRQREAAQRGEIGDAPAHALGAGVGASPPARRGRARACDRARRGAPPSDRARR